MTLNGTYYGLLATAALAPGRKVVAGALVAAIVLIAGAMIVFS